jgi:photosystem II stability/assembly factor-like uncharacterized protein
MTKQSLFEPGGAGRIPALLLAMALIGGASCEACDNKGSGGGGGGGGGGSWLVGTSALMLNIDHSRLGEVGSYDLQMKDDLLGIACRGTREAWVVGARGLLIATGDGGVSWNVLDPGVTSTLRAVALSAPNVVLVAGDDGVARISPDAGRHWRALATPALTWTSVALRRNDGGIALLASVTGEIFRYDAATGAVTEVAKASVPLRSIVMARDGLSAVAVGDRGQMLISTDAGLTFSARSTGASVDLRDVWLIGQGGERFMAVGDGGTILQGLVRDLTGEVASRSLGAALSLRALHLQGDGHGMIVGDHGTAFFTEDFGTSWSAVGTGDARDILGVDALDFGSEHY